MTLQRYRVRRGLFGTSVMQELKENGAKSAWKDVPYSRAPRALCNEFDVIDQMEKVKVENAELRAELDAKS